MMHINTRYEELVALWPGVIEFQKLAHHYGISDVFADAGGKMVQLAVVTGIDLSGQRTGPDGSDRTGNDYEVKTTDLSKTASGFSTSHHLNGTTLSKYRRCRWIFAFYHGIALHEVYRLDSRQMAPLFAQWAERLRHVDHLNNPKIPLRFVHDTGTLMFRRDDPSETAPTAA